MIKIVSFYHDSSKRNVNLFTIAIYKKYIQCFFFVFFYKFGQIKN